MLAIILCLSSRRANYPETELSSFGTCIYTTGSDSSSTSTPTTLVTTTTPPTTATPVYNSTLQPVASWWHHYHSWHYWRHSHQFGTSQFIQNSIEWLLSILKIFWFILLFLVSISVTILLG